MYFICIKHTKHAFSGYRGGNILLLYSESDILNTISCLKYGYCVY